MMKLSRVDLRPWIKSRKYMWSISAMVLLPYLVFIVPVIVLYSHRKEFAEGLQELWWLFTMQVSE